MPWRSHRVDHEHADADDEPEVGDVGDVRPDLIAAPGPSKAEGKPHTRERMDEIPHAGESQPVVQIPQPAREEQPDSRVGPSVAGPGPSSEERQAEGESSAGKDDEEPAFAGAHSEDRAWVQNQGELEHAGDDDNGWVRGNQGSEESRCQDILSANLDG